MKKISEEHRNKPLAILVDGKVLSAPVIKSVIADGKVQLTGKFTHGRDRKTRGGDPGK